MPEYPDIEARDRVVAALTKLPPLVTSWEVEELKSQLADAARGKRFLLQGGDCSESFDDCESKVITNKLKILLQMSLVLVSASKRQVIRVGRIGGQYAKPRSADMETIDGVTLPVYRGDLINRLPFTKEDRIPNPELMLRGYERSALTLNFIRSLVDGGFADLHHQEYWDLDFVAHSPEAAEYRRIVETISDSLKFLETVLGGPVDDFERVDFHTSHEGLHLFYEQAHTRHVPHRTGWYNLSTHFPWIGERTRALDGAHVEFFRGIANPIAVKIGPSISPDELLDLIKILDPNNEPGRLTLIHRFGADRIGTALPPLIDVVRDADRLVVWCCDPMHGNTEQTSSGMKTRSFERILQELELAFQVHNELGSYLGGAHLELTGDQVTECTGGARGLTEEDLRQNYRTQVDPRLNYEQALETAMLIARLMIRYNKRK
ncbi:MAG: 3-deoxy-7-phosphoheptulonate synthase class II [Acidobacteriota bacterium]|nr:MAG: 3-deoxy-7-phosphoheptulonate synthase class II [Acidobacteriota bacterium]